MMSRKMQISSIVDQALPGILDRLGDRDLLIVTADHGCDPTFRGTDHTREYIPFLMLGRGIVPGSMGVRDTFGDVGATVLEALGAEAPQGRNERFVISKGKKNTRCGIFRIAY